jgi:hypothetical protein
LIQLLYLLCTVAYHLSSDSVNLNILNFPKVRKQVYIVWNSEPRENIGVLNELMDARDELAKVLLFLHICEIFGLHYSTVISLARKCNQHNSPR